jgi:hypothetical protein
MRIRTNLCKTLVLLTPCVLGLVVAGSARAAIIDFTFADGPRVNGTATAFDTPGTLGSTFVVDGVTLTSVTGSGPSYVDQGGNNYTWDGTSYVASTTNFGSNDYLGISNPSIPGVNDSNFFNPQETWTVSFTHDVIFRLIAAASVGSADTMQITFGSSTFNFADGDFNSSDDKADPFGPTEVIPAGTNITFRNSGTYPSFPLTTTNPAAGNAWGLNGFTVETVPEPSALFLVIFGSIGIGMTLLRRKTLPRKVVIS